MVRIRISSPWARGSIPSTARPATAAIRSRSPIGDVLTDRQIRAVLAFIKSTWPPPERQAQDRVNGRQR